MKRMFSVVLLLLSCAGFHGGLLAQVASSSSKPHLPFEVEKQATVKANAVIPYPPSLMAARIDGEVLAQFVVDDSGRFVPGSFKAIKSPHELFTQAVKDALPLMTFNTAMVGGKPVSQTVQMPFSFSLPSATAATLSARPRPLRPAVIRFGWALADLRDPLSNQCTRATVREIPVFRVLRGLTEKQFQIDCEGFVFEGSPRHAEFVFSDDGLEMVWIMTTAADSSALTERMTTQFGAPTMRNQKFIAWPTAVAALRMDVPEVLFYSDRLGPRIVEWFGPNSTF